MTLEQVKRTPRTIVIADDYSDTLEISQLILEHAGHTVYTAEDGAEALELVKKYVPDLAVVDLHLPHLDGITVGQRVRSDATFNDTVLMAYTASTDTGKIQHAADTGFDYYACKPLDTSIFLEAAYAPRQQRLILLSQSLIDASSDLRSHGTMLSQRSNVARERSRVMIREMMVRYQHFRSLPPTPPQ
jgi:CheY-like chemotaxis protein